jgi:hypothetical protein
VVVGLRDWRFYSVPMESNTAGYLITKQMNDNPMEPIDILSNFSCTSCLPTIAPVAYQYLAVGYVNKMWVTPQFLYGIPYTSNSSGKLYLSFKFR